MDLGALSDEISSSDSVCNTPDTERSCVTLASAVNRHAPLITKTIPARPFVPWFNEDIKENINAHHTFPVCRKYDYFLE